MTRTRQLARSRPVIGGLLLVLAGIEIIAVDGRGVGVVLSGAGSATPSVLGGALILFGLLAWATPHYAPLLGVLAQLTAVLAFVAANLGGYVLGSLLGVIGGALVFAWRTDPPSAEEADATGCAAREGVTSEVAS